MVLLAQDATSALWVQSGIMLGIGILASWVSIAVAKHGDKKQDDEQRIKDAVRAAEVDSKIKRLEETQEATENVGNEVALIRQAQDTLVRELHEFRSDIKAAITKLFEMVHAPADRIAEFGIRQQNMLERVRRIEDNLRKCPSCRLADASNGIDYSVNPMVEGGSSIGRKGIVDG